MVKDPKGREKPEYKRHVFICTHEREPSATRPCCSAKDSLEVTKSMKMAAKKEGLIDVRIQKSGRLDFCENGLINNPYLLNNPTIWPKKVIVMMLHRVGSTNGIDFKQLKNIIKLNNNSEIYVAGGIQNFSDINNLNSMKVRGCLVELSLIQI